MQTFQYGFTCLLLVFFSKTAHAALEADCVNNGGCDEPNEVCDTSDTNKCICNAGYQAGPVTTTSCFQAVNLAVTCTTAGVNDECLLGNGGSGTICTGATPDCQCDTGNKYVEDNSTCKIDCGAPTAPTNGAVDSSPGTTYGKQATYSCNTGFSLTGNAQVLCKADGTWETAPTCPVTDCGAPTAPTNGAVDSSPGTTYGKQATYSCNTGFSLTGNAQVLCKADGTWETAPTCPVTDCGPLTDPTDGSIAYSSGTTYNSVATFSCNADHTLIGTATRTCGAGGAWDGSDPTCPINCGALTAPTNGAVDSSPGTTYGKQATYSCNTGFSLSGNPQVLCKADGTWETAPTCPITDCGEPPNETGYTASKDGGTTYQETATVICDSANGWSGTAANISCEASGSWTSYSGCSGASEIRQNFNLVVLIVALVIALM